MKKKKGGTKKKATFGTLFASEPIAIKPGDYPPIATGQTYQDEIRASSLLFQETLAKSITGQTTTLYFSFPGQYLGLSHIRIQSGTNCAIHIADDNGNLLYNAQSPTSIDIDLVFTTTIYFFGSLKLTPDQSAGATNTFFIDVQGRLYGSGFLP